MFLFFPTVENGKFISRDILSQWSLEQTTVCNHCLENIGQYCVE